MIKRVLFRYALVFVGNLLFTFNGNAACLGLDPPTPKTTNICERLVERLVVPKIEKFCDIPWYVRPFIPPHCHAPGACLVDPMCKFLEETKEIGEYVFNAGDLYCDSREIKPEKIIEGIGNQAFVDVVKLTTGGHSSLLFDIANRHIDTLSCNASPLNKEVKEWITCVTSKSTVPQNEYFSPIDVERVRVISQTYPLADKYLRSGYDAITLNDLVIMNDVDFQILKGWRWRLSMALNSAEQAALGLMIHELVHVRQYRNMGKEVFVNRYLAEAIIKGYPSISTEKEAKRYENWALSTLPTPNLCAAYQPTEATDPRAICLGSPSGYRGSMGDCLSL